MRKTFQYFDIIIAVYAAMLLISNLAATKLIAFGPIIADAGGIMFPLTYILDDVLTEVYGYKYARRAIWTAFGVMLLAVVVFTIARYLPSAPEYTDQKAFEAVLGFFPRIVLASLTAFLVGSFLNSYILAKLKIRTKGRQMWLRLVGSTAIGELFDTTIFGLVAFAGVLGFKDMIIYILVGWFFKTAVEVIFLPVTYFVVNRLKRVEGVDAYDKKTNFTPLSIKL